MTPTVLAAMLIAIGTVLLTAGADALIRGATGLALRAGVTPLMIGLTVVAFGTSMPELVVSVRAATIGNADIAVGNVVGSNIANIGLILGLAALIRPLRVHSRVIRIDAPLVAVASLALLWLVRDDVLSTAEGVSLLLCLALYITLGWRLAQTEAVDKNIETATAGSMAAATAWLVAGFALLVGGAQLLVRGAVQVAQGAGVSDAVIGLTVVAVGTSLPELATSVVAAYRGQGDLSVGNAVGSNMFNILGILGLAAVIHPLSVTGISRVDLLVMVGAALLLLPLMRSGSRLSRLEGGFMLAGYGAYVAYLMP